MMNMTEFVAAGGADCAAAYWRYCRRQEETQTKPKQDPEPQVFEPAYSREMQLDAQEIFESGWDI